MWMLAMGSYHWILTIGEFISNQLAISYEMNITDYISGIMLGGHALNAHCTNANNELN